MEKVLCAICFKPKATLSCGVCADDICKYCAQFLAEDSFAFLTQKPSQLQYDTFCGPCHDTLVAPELEAYRASLESAKEILIFFKTQNKETRFIRRDEDRIHTLACENRDDALMSLAFQAVRGNFNGVIDIELAPCKIQSGSYHTTQWKASGIPAHVNPDKLLKDRSFTSRPN